MTIPSRSDKIAPVADDGALKSHRESGQPETRRRNSRGHGSGRRGAGSAEKTDEKNCWQRLADVITYTSCRLKRTERKAEGQKRKIKKFLTKRKRFDKISKLSREKNDRNLDNWTIDNNPWKFLWRENFSNSGDRASTAVVRRIYFPGTTRASIGGANEARNFVSSLGAVEAEPNNSKRGKN